MKLSIKLLVLALLSALLAGCATYGRGQSAQSIEAQRTRAQIAEAMFQERCKTAGEKIYKTVENVEGILLMKVRPKEVNFGDQFALTDPYGDDLGGDGYIVSFSRGSFQANTIGAPAPGSPSRIGYRYVEAIDPQDGKRYRYIGSKKATRRKDASAPNVQLELKRDPNYDLSIYEYVLDKVSAPGAAPRYGVTYDDISSREEREYWIAGSSLKVVDLQAGEVIAERIGYMMDWAQGSRVGGRSPWLFAADHACPSFHRNPFRPSGPSGSGAAAQSRQTQDFIEKVLKPKLGE